MRTLEVEALAMRLVPGAGPARVRLVGAGLGSETYRVERGDESFSLRVAARADSRDAFDPLWEYRVRELAGSAGLAPAVLHADAAAGIMLARWVEGRTWSAAEACEPARVAQVALLVRRIHALTPPRPARRVAPAEWIARYEMPYAGMRRAAANFDALRAEAVRRIEALARLPAAAVLCHSDLHRLNVVETPSALVALDWEYAHVTDPLWDLAGWSSVNDFGAAMSGDLLRGYLGRRWLPAEWARFRHLAWLYDYVCLIWSEVYLARHADRIGADELARAQHLAARLESDLGGSAGEVPAD